MRFIDFDNSRSCFGFNILKNKKTLAVISGIFLGLGAFLLKIGFANKDILSSIFSVFTILASILLLTGFLLFQKAIRESYVSIAAPVSIGLSIAIPVLLSFSFLNDYVSFLKWFGILFILFGILMLPS